MDLLSVQMQRALTPHKEFSPLLFSSKNRGCNSNINPTLLNSPLFFVARFNELKAKHYTGPDSNYISLTIGTPPPQPPLRYVVSLIQRLANNLWRRLSETVSQWLGISSKHTPQPLHKYTDLNGDPKLKSAFVSYFQRRFGATIEPTQLIPFSGSNEAIFLLLSMGLNALQTNQRPAKLWLPAPGYPTYLLGAQMGGFQMIPAPITPNNQFQFDYESAWNRMKPEERSAIKGIVINYPNNPTGAMASEAYLKQVLDFAKRHHLLLMNDMAYAETYRSNLPPSQRPVSLFELLDPNDTTTPVIEWHSFSKAYGMSGDRQAFAVLSKGCGQANNPASLRYNYQKLRTMTHATAQPLYIQQAASDMLSNVASTQEYIDESNKEYTRKWDAVAKTLKPLRFEIPVTNSLPFYVWAKIPATYEEKSGFTSRDESYVAELLKATGVGVTPGSYFDPVYGANYVRIAIMQPMEVIKKALKKIAWFEAQQANGLPQTEATHF